MELISICIPAYNANKYIKQTLKAILSQNYSNFEIIVIDDQSTDETFTTVENFNDLRVKIFKSKSKGAAAARNQAFNLSKGKYIVFMDADDWMPNNFLESQISCLNHDDEVIIAQWGRFYKDDLSTIEIDKGQSPIDLNFKQWILAYWTNNSHMTCPGRIMMTRDLILEAGLWDEELSLNDDFQFYSQIFSKSSVIKFNPHTVFYYRSGINGLSSIKSERAYSSNYKSICKGIQSAQNKYQNDKDLNQAFANLLQNFIYETYPLNKELIIQAESAIQKYGGADFKFPAGGKTAVLNSIFGWKLVKRIKLWMSEAR